MLEFKLGCYRPYPLKEISSPRFSWAGLRATRLRDAESWAARLGRAELGQAGACAGRAGRPSGVASWAQERSLGCLRLGRPGGESGLGPVAEFWAGLVWVGFGFWVPFLFQFFSFPLNSKLFEFKWIWIQTPIQTNKTKPCTSMNATQIFKPMTKF